jgi:uncharacterized protein (DUF1800 family)
VPRLHEEIRPWQEVYRWDHTSYAKRQEAGWPNPLPSPAQFWNPLIEFCRTTDRPFLARLLLDGPNFAPTSEGDVHQVYSFWGHCVLPNLLSKHGDLLKSVILNHSLYRSFLNTNLNVGPNSARGRKLPPDENLARELMEVLSYGPAFQDTGDMTELALLLTGLRSDGYDPTYAEPGTRTILGRTFAQGDIAGFLDWIAVHPATARHQVDRMVRPILGRNLTPALHDHLAERWIATGGDRRAVLQAMVMHDDAWSPLRGAPVNTLVGYVSYLHEHGIVLKPGKTPFVVWQTHLGYRYEAAPNPKGLAIDDRLIGGGFLLHRAQWPGTLPQRLSAMSHTRTIV